MKKSLLLALVASVCALNMIAQTTATNPLLSGVNFNVTGQISAPNPNFDPEEPVSEDNPVYLKDTWTIPSVTESVSISFTEYNPDVATAGGWTPYLMTVAGAGFGVDPVPYVLGDFANSGSATNFVFPMEKSTWGNPYLGNFHVTLMVCFINEEGDFLMGSDEEPVMYQAIYTTPNTFPAELISTYPNNEWENETFAEAYADGKISFLFANPVEFSNANLAATIIYRLTEGNPQSKTLTENDIEAGWEYMDGYYALTFNYAKEGLDANAIDNITITLINVKSLNQTISVPAIVLNNFANISKGISQKSKAATAGVADGLVNNLEFDVYSVDGRLVREKSSSLDGLDAGIYIVNGKKIIIR